MRIKSVLLLAGVLLFSGVQATEGVAYPLEHSGYSPAGGDTPDIALADISYICGSLSTSFNSDDLKVTIIGKLAVNIKELFLAGVFDQAKLTALYIMLTRKMVVPSAIDVESTPDSKLLEADIYTQKHYAQEAAGIGEWLASKIASGS